MWMRLKITVKVPVSAYLLLHHRNKTRTEHSNECDKGPVIGDCGGFGVPRPKIMTQFGCHIHLKIMLNVPHPRPNNFSLNLDELES